jgi:hypothetical protein
MLDAACGERGAGGKPGRPGAHHHTIDHPLPRLPMAASAIRSRITRSWHPQTRVVGTAIPASSSGGIGLVPSSRSSRRGRAGALDQLTEPGKHASGVRWAVGRLGSAKARQVRRDHAIRPDQVGLVEWAAALRSGGIHVSGPRTLSRALPTWNAGPETWAQRRQRLQPTPGSAPAILP